MDNEQFQKRVDGVEVNFTEKELKQLMEYYKNRQFSQFAGVCVTKSLREKKHTENESKVFRSMTALMADKLTEMPPPATESISDIEILASGLYKLVHAIDVKETYTDDF